MHSVFKKSVDVVGSNQVQQDRNLVVTPPPSYLETPPDSDKSRKAISPSQAKQLESDGQTVLFDPLKGPSPHKKRRIDVI